MLAACYQRIRQDALSMREIGRTGSRLGVGVLLGIALVGCHTEQTSEAVAPNPVPTIQAIAPRSSSVGHKAQTLQVVGLNFVRGASVSFYDNSVNPLRIVRPANVLTAGELTVPLFDAEQAIPHKYLVGVINPAPGGGPSAQNVIFEIK